jgi:N6-L-threonylcarbamoyladenine synthase
MILGIETSCDETSVALIDRDGVVRSNRIASQIERHRPFGGVVPEIASREHLEHLAPLLDEASREAGIELHDIDAVAVTNGPGLIGALLVGVAAAQGLSYGLGKMLIPVNHLEGHIYSPYLRTSGAAIPRPERFWCLVASGGHSAVYDVTRSGVLQMNRTRDDAAGEVFDKVAKVLGLDYPGGPEIDRLARDGDGDRFDFSVARFKAESLDFSFSGLKSNAIRLARELRVTEPARDEKLLADFCASFQRAVVTQLVDRLEKLWDRATPEERPVEIALAGGVAANSLLRSEVERWGGQHSLTVRLPQKIFCTDNGAMIAFAALNKGSSAAADPKSVKAFSRSPI